MAIEVIGGLVSNNNNAKNNANVVNIIFDTNQRVNGKIPPNTEGVMILKNVPDIHNFVVTDALNYKDSNNNNDATLTVTSVIGPIKYKVVVSY